MLLPAMLPRSRAPGEPPPPPMCWPQGTQPMPAQQALQAQSQRLGMRAPHAPWAADDDPGSGDLMEVMCDNPGLFVGQPLNKLGVFLGEHSGAEGATNSRRQHRALDGNEPVRVRTRLDCPKAGPAAGLRSTAAPASRAAPTVPSHPPGRLGLPPVLGQRQSACGFPSPAGLG
ncbi:unnamed protein product, partial [Prorocentrum cordatum]